MSWTKSTAFTLRSLTFWECKPASVTVSRIWSVLGLFYHGFWLSGSARQVRQIIPAQTVLIVCRFPRLLKYEALKLHVCVKNTSTTVFGFLRQLDKLRQYLRHLCASSERFHLITVYLAIATHYSGALVKRSVLLKEIVSIYMAFEWFFTVWAFSH